MPSRWLALKDFLFDSSSKLFSSSNSRPCNYPDYPYERLENSNMAAPEEVVDSESTRHHGVDAALAKRVLRKIDMRLIPLLFITYGLNFMDKTILSSASVFGLRDDTVCLHLLPARPPARQPLTHSLTHTTSMYSISSASNTPGSPQSSTLATSSGPPSPTNSSPASPPPATSPATPYSGAPSSPSQQHAPTTAASSPCAFSWVSQKPQSPRPSCS